MNAAWRKLTVIAWRESRTARRRLLLYMSSISLGVAALVAIDSFSANVTRSVHEQSRALLGGDVALSSRQAFTPSVDSLLDSLHAAGTGVARVISFASMPLVERTGATRLAQVRAVEPGYPFYGEITTRPAAQWERLHEGRHALVDPALLVSLDARVGDTVALGFSRFTILAALHNVPGDVGVTAAIGPRIFIPAEYLAETGLLVFGSRARTEAILRLPDGTNPQRFVNQLNARLDSARVRARTVAGTEADLTEAVAELGTFLGIVGLVALLLGGIGVASGVHAFVAGKIDTVAVLRCLGATGWQVLGIYVLQAALMGLAGAAAGAAIGVAIQLVLPRVIGDFIPVEVGVQLVPGAIAAGLLVGVWVALVFSLQPLVALRRISPLQALRRDADPDVLRLRWRDWDRLLVSTAIVASVVALSIARAQTLIQGLWFSAAVGGALAVLTAAAVLLSIGARRLLRRGWPFVVRQGVANLYRPANQTRAVMLALGFGVFLIGTLNQVQSSLLGRFGRSLRATDANVLFFDVQGDQSAGLDSMIQAAGHRVLQRAPIVPMRIASINGRDVASLLGDTARSEWPLRREYRSTYRDTLVASERITGGSWSASRRRDARDSIAAVSFEREVARELGLSLGDVVTWDVQGVQVPSRVKSFREVDWARFEPNFFAVFEPAALEEAPQQFVLLAAVPGDTAVAHLQRSVVQRYPNISSLDLTLIQETIGKILQRVSVAIRFMTLFSIAIGVPVLVSAVAATRRERLREGVLLRTLGATRAQVRRIMLAEYALLGALGALTGILLSLAGGWGLARFVFDVPFVPAVLPALALLAAMLVLAIGIGMLTGREVYRETPVVALREA